VANVPVLWSTLCMCFVSKFPSRPVTRDYVDFGNTLKRALSLLLVLIRHFYARILFLLLTFYPREALLAPYMLWFCVCPSVFHKSEFYQTGWTWDHKNNSAQ